MSTVTGFIKLMSVIGTGAVMAAVLVQPANAADAISNGQWYHAALKTDAAHKITTGAGVTVAVIDSGVDDGHPDLAGSILPGLDLTEEGPGDGTTDVDGHGTAMAGLIAAHGKVEGVAPGAKILPVRTLTRADGVSQLARGIRWAVEQRPDVISISQGSDYDEPDIRRAVETALAADIVVVAASGNRTKSTEVGYPAAVAGVIAVSGVDGKGNHSLFSASGASIDLAAPGEEISSTYIGGNWVTTTGTSGAAALVAGVAALIRSHFPDMSAAEVAHRLTATAVDRGSLGPDRDYGFGIVDAAAALTAQVPWLSPSPGLSATGAPLADGEPVHRFPLVPVGGLTLGCLLATLGGSYWYRRRRRARNS